MKNFVSVIILAVFLAIWALGGVDWLECELKGAEYMASRGQACPAHGATAEDLVARGWPRWMIVGD
jgi:hypothetical protein